MEAVNIVLEKLNHISITVIFSKLKLGACSWLSHWIDFSIKYSSNHFALFFHFLLKSLDLLSDENNMLLLLVDLLSAKKMKVRKSEMIGINDLLALPVLFFSLHFVNCGTCFLHIIFNGTIIILFQLLVQLHCFLFLSLLMIKFLFPAL